jgi:hypothetical protein
MNEIHVAYAQHRGLARRTQQDALLVAGQGEQSDDLFGKGLVLDAAEGLCAVADGVAATAYPDLASRTVLEALREAAQARPDLCQEGWIGPRMLRHFVHDHLYRRLSGDPRRRGSATTLALLQWCAERFSVLNVGDSRVYRIDAAGGWQRLSKDHAYLTSIGEHDKLDPDQSEGELYYELEHMLSAEASADNFAVHWLQGQWAAGDKPHPTVRSMNVSGTPDWPAREPQGSAGSVAPQTSVSASHRAASLSNLSGVNYLVRSASIILAGDWTLLFVLGFSS